MDQKQLEEPGNELRNLVPETGKPGMSGGAVYSHKQIALAFVVAVLADTVCEMLVTPMSQVVDLVTMGLLFLILGRNWVLVPVFLVELIPGAGVFPTWTVFVAAMTGKEWLSRKR